jgi:hypothetical protein
MATIISDANVTSYVRSLLNEASAKFWTDAEITNFIKFGMVEAQARFHTWLYKKTKKLHQLSTVAAQADYDLSSTPGDIHTIQHISVAETGAHLRYINDDEYWKYAQVAAGEPRAWMWYDNKVRLIPTPAAASTNYLNIWYSPQITTTITFPESVRPWIAVQAVISALTKDKAVTPDLIALAKHYEENVMIEIIFDQMQEAEQFGDYGVEDRIA